MAVEFGYPVTLVHPNYQKAKIAVGNEPAVAERFPAVEVNGADSEAQYRALGYLRFGEPQAAGPKYQKYPLFLRHKDYVPEIPARTEAKIENNKIVGTFTIPATPAYMPDVIVDDAEKEEHYREQGYDTINHQDDEEMERFLNTPVDEDGDYVAQEYPKWVNGILVEKDPNAPEEVLTDPSYPRYEGSRVVHDPRFEEEPDPTVYPKWIHRNGKPGEGSVLVKNSREETEALRKLAAAEPKEEDGDVKNVLDELVPPPAAASRRRSASV